MESGKPDRVVLIDENATVAGAMKSYLQEIGYGSVEAIRSVNEMRDQLYDTVFLNLSYYQNFQAIMRKVTEVQTHKFNRLIVFSNICLYNRQLANLDERITILCKDGQSRWGRPPSGADQLGPVCFVKCDKFELDGHDGNDAIKEKIDRLTEREKEILCMIGKGMRSEDIAESLHVSKRTVDFHRRNILRKANLSGLAQLIAMGVYLALSLT